MGFKAIFVGFGETVTRCYFSLLIILVIFCMSRVSLMQHRVATMHGLMYSLLFVLIFTCLSVTSGSEHVAVRS